jgi:DNA-directed RNA polymerase subunit L
MEYKIINDKKDELEIELDNLTVAEILRVYLNLDDSVKIAAWKKEHPSKNPILIVQTKGKSPRKAISDAVGKIEKELDKVLEQFKSVKYKVGS